MALIILGSSKCCICNDIINEDDNYRSFPPFMNNMLDPLYIFSDAVVHEKCLNKSSVKNKLIKFLELYYQKLPLNEQKCIVDGMKMIKYDDVIFFGILSSNEDDPLYKYNYIVLNKVNIERWKDLKEFVLDAENYLKENKWNGFAGFNPLKRIIYEIKNNSIAE